MDGQARLVERHLDSGSYSRFFIVPKAGRTERNAGLEGLDEKPILWSSGTKNPGSFQSAGTKRAARNHHPTVKPLALVRYLMGLVAPAGGVVLDPFAGSGTTGIAAILSRRPYILIEKEAEYLPIIEGRLAWARGLGL